MATRYFLGQAKQVAQVNTVTIAGTWAAADTITITVNGVDFVVTIGSLVTTAQVATTLNEAFNGTVSAYTDTTASSSPTLAQGGAQAIPQLAAITATVSGSVVSLTADEEGVPFTVTVTESTAGTGTAAGAVATAATGKWFWSDADNWSGATVPVGADDVIIDRPLPILYGLDQSAVTLTSLTIAATFQDGGYLGLPRDNPGGYAEYRDDYLKIGATTCRIGTGTGNGSNRIKINFGSVQTALEVQKTAQSLETGVPACLILGTHASNAADIQEGEVGFGFYGEATTLLTLRVAAGGTATCGAGCTLGTVTGEGTVGINGAVTTITQYAGDWTISGGGAVTTLTVITGTLHYESSGTVTTANIGGTQGSATVDCSQDASARTFTTTNLKAGGRIVDPMRTITFTNGIAMDSQAREVAAA